MTELTHLEAGWCKDRVGHFTGFQTLNNLTYLDLTYAKVTGLNWLSDQSKLEHLYLSHNGSLSEWDIVGLTRLQHLTHLGIADIQFIDGHIDFLSHFPQLKHLDLSLNYTRISDFTPLESLTVIESLKLRQTDIPDLSVITGLSHLKSLELSYIDLTNIDALAQLTQLKELDLSDNHLTDLSALSDLDQLERLYVAENPLADMNAVMDMLTELPHLNTLSISDCNSGAIVALGRLAGLKDLYAETQGDADLAPLANLVALERLFIRGGAWLENDTLAPLIHLKALELWIDPPDDLTVFSGFTKLERLHLNGPLVTDVTPLANLIHLRSLNLNQTKIEDTTPFSHLTDLKFLSLINGGLDNITPLAGLTRLIELDISRNELTDLGALVNMTMLDDLRVQNNPLTQETLDVTIPLIEANNPGIYIRQE